MIIPSCRPPHPPQPTPSLSFTQRTEKEAGRERGGCEGWSMRVMTGPISFSECKCRWAEGWVLIMKVHIQNSFVRLLHLQEACLNFYFQQLSVSGWVPETWTTANHSLLRSYPSPCPGDPPPTFLVLWASYFDRWWCLLSTTDCFSQVTISTPNVYLTFLANSLPCHLS